MTAKTLFGLEQTLADELHGIGAADVEVLNRAVRFSGNDALLYRANLELSTALAILKPVATFDVHTEEQLYHQIRDIDWSLYLRVDQSFLIDSTTHSRRFRHSHYAALKAKDAIVDQFRERYRKRPSVDTGNPDLKINLHISDRTCTVSLDSSGTSLDRRGYRLARTEAPINEILAAGILSLSGWDRTTPLLDPMCGSGTFAIEAARMASGAPPGANRMFAFEKWNNFDPKLWKKVKAEALKKVKKPKVPLFAYDIDARALDIARENASRAGMEAYIRFQKMDFLQSTPPTDTGLIVMNPPYGERLEPNMINQLYNDIGSHLKHAYNGWEAWIISSNMDALKQVGLRTSRKIQLYNGSLACKLHKYELYRGTRKLK